MTNDCCIVCYSESNFHPQTKCCGQRICEGCYYHKLLELCPICDREELNKKDMHCDYCNYKIKRLDYRVCSGCDTYCCTNCSHALECCSFDNNQKCNCCFCEDCQERFEDSDETCIYAHIENMQKRKYKDSDDDNSDESTYGYDTDDYEGYSDRTYSSSDEEDENLIIYTED
jgi:hypothetical protein